MNIELSSELRFVPRDVTVQPGTSLTWTLSRTHGGIEHDVVSAGEVKVCLEREEEGSDGGDTVVEESSSSSSSESEACGEGSGDAWRGEKEGDEGAEGEGSLYAAMAKGGGGSASGAATQWLEGQRSLGVQHRQRRGGRGGSNPKHPATLTLPCLSFDSPALSRLGDAQAFQFTLPDSTALWEALRNSINETPQWKGVKGSGGGASGRLPKGPVSLLLQYSSGLYGHQGMRGTGRIPIGKQS